MTTNKTIILQPDYFKDFNCIGSECEDSCCIGWKVSLDKKTYLKYKRMKNKELESIVENSVNRDRSQNTDSSYGKIQMETNGRCPFLNEENLCKIYIHAGEEYLSNTCTFYPRTTSRIDGNWERSATVSCPEVTRLALLNPDGIAFEHIEEDFEEIHLQSQLDTEGNPFIKDAKKYFWDIRIFSLSLLQNRNYNIADRLIILGIFYKRLEALEDQSEMDKFPEMIESMARSIENGIFKDELDKISTDTEIQMILAKSMTDNRSSKGISSSRYLEALKETLLGLGFIDDKEPEEALENYEKSYEEYYKPYMDKKEYIIENYLVNEYFKEMMPFGSYKTIWDSYIFLCSLYSMVKLHLIGMASYNKELNDEILVRLIQSFSKVVLHNNSYIQQIIQVLKDNGLDSLAYMAILVKN